MNKNRREFIKISSIAGTCLMVTAFTPGLIQKTKAETQRPKNQENGLIPEIFIPDAWIKISPDNIVTVMVNHTEMGQGVTTALPMIVAEELEADFSKVRFEIAPVKEVYKNPKYGVQTTVGSTSIQTSWNILRKAGATTRELFIRAGAKQLAESATDCYASDSRVIHKASGKSISYGELIPTALSLSLPRDVSLKKPEAFKLIGKNVTRLDTIEKIKGNARFGIDIRIPGMLVATVIHPKGFGATLKSMDVANAKKVPGVHSIFEINRGIAIVADSFYTAQTASKKLAVKWEINRNPHLSSNDIFKRWAALPHEKAKTMYEKGEMSVTDENTISATYRLPYQAHATPEPMNCTAHVHEKGCDIWVPTQNQGGAMETVVQLTGLDKNSIHIHTPYAGGGFGRRVAVDYVEEAVQISQKIKRPVKVIWTRKEDMQNGQYRPASYNVIKAGLGNNGLPNEWSHLIVGEDHMTYQLKYILPSKIPGWLPRPVRNIGISLAKRLVPGLIAGKKIIEGAAPLPYDIENIKVDFLRDDPGIPLGFWRSVAYSSNTFVVESFIDEIAYKNKIDPYEFRVRLLSKNRRLQAVLKLAAKKADWEKKNENRFQGIAAMNFHDTLLCFVAQVSIDKHQTIKVHKMVCAVDCGIVIHPKTVEAQMQSAIAFGLTATLKNSVTIKNNQAEQTNMDDFPILRMNEMPEVSVHTIKSDQPPTGIGEAGVPLVAPAVANAVFSATGRRVRHLPITPEDCRI